MEKSSGIYKTCKSAVLAIGSKLFNEKALVLFVSNRVRLFSNWHTYRNS